MTYSVIAEDIRTEEIIFAHGVYTSLDAAVAAKEEMESASKIMFSRPVGFMIHPTA